jgi:hypothetical protein
MECEIVGLSDRCSGLRRGEQRRLTSRDATAKQSTLAYDFVGLRADIQRWRGRLVTPVRQVIAT